MPGQPIPDEIMALAQERATARAERDWTVADRLKARIEAEGWRVVDDGVEFSLSPVRPPDVVVDGRTLYGAIESVPSRLDEPAALAATIVILTGADAQATEATLGALAQHRPPDTEVLVVTDRDMVVAGPADEIIRSVEPFSAGDALQAALRRASGSLVVVLEPGRLPAADVVRPLRDVLADPSVAVAGCDGMHSADLHRYQPAASGDVTALRSGCYAFRREDVLAYGPVDGRLRMPGSVATWWSLTLRDAGSEASPRRAVAIELPLGSGEDGAMPEDQPRLARRDAYRIADQFRDRDWLANGQPPQGRLVGDGADERNHDDQPDEGGHTAQA